MQYSNDAAERKLKKTDWHVICIVFWNISHDTQPLEVYDWTFSHRLVLKNQSSKPSKTHNTKQKSKNWLPVAQWESISKARRQLCISVRSALSTPTLTSVTVLRSSCLVSSSSRGAERTAGEHNVFARLSCIRNLVYTGRRRAMLSFAHSLIFLFLLPTVAVRRNKPTEKLENSLANWVELYPSLQKYTQWLLIR